MPTKEAMFESPGMRDARPIAWVKRACAILVSVYLKPSHSLTTSLRDSPTAKPSCARLRFAASN